MPCPFHGGHGDKETADDSSTDDRSRRNFLKAAVAIGGANALSACVERTGEQSVASPTPKYAEGPADLSTLPERQHAWADYIRTNRQNQVVFPQHQIFVFLEYTPDELPTERDRERVESAFRTLERAFQRGVGTEGKSYLIDGLLFMIGYSPSYFDRFPGDLPDSTGLERPETVLDSLGEDASLAESYDAVLHMGSDKADILLGAEQALFGEIETINGHSVDGTLAESFVRTERRAGLIGDGIPDRELDVDVSPKSPLPMGFKSAFEDTLPTEDAITIEEGPFSGGTTQIVSLLEEKLEEWYDQTHQDRIDKMFAPSFDSQEDVGQAGELLGNSSELTADTAKEVAEAAESEGRVGHSQKLLRARNDDFEPIIHRRGDFFQTGRERTVLNFGAIQRTTDDFIETRRAMNDIEFGTDSEVESVPREENGLLNYIETLSRATFLVPPRSLRSLPSARP